LTKQAISHSGSIESEIAVSNPKPLQTPLSDERVRELRVGDRVAITGIVYTARDAVHKHLATGGDLPGGADLRGGVVYHCGPVAVRGDDGRWQIVAAGPTTSFREEPYQAEIIRKFGLRAVIGKGGMGSKTLEALRQYGCVYLHAVGGAAQVLAECVTAVQGVWFLDEFGAPEAMWKLVVKNFPAVVTMDANGNSLHELIRASSQTELARALSNSA